MKKVFACLITVVLLSVCLSVYVLADSSIPPFTPANGYTYYLAIEINGNWYLEVSNEKLYLVWSVSNNEYVVSTATNMNWNNESDYMYQTDKWVSQGSCITWHKTSTVNAYSTNSNIDLYNDPGGLVTSGYFQTVNSSSSSVSSSQSVSSSSVVSASSNSSSVSYSSSGIVVSINNTSNMANAIDNVGKNVSGTLPIVAPLAISVVGLVLMWTKGNLFFKGLTK